MDEWGNLVIVTDLRNDTPYLVGKVQVVAALYSAEGEILERQSVMPLLRRIRPWGQSPAIILMSGDGVWKSYSLRAEGLALTGDSESGLGLVASEGYTDDAGLYHVWGKVRNQSDRSQRYASVVVALYDSGGDIVNACLAHTVPEALVPGTLGTFNCSFDYSRGTVRYTIHLEGD